MKKYILQFLFTNTLFVSILPTAFALELISDDAGSILAIITIIGLLINNIRIVVKLKEYEARIIGRLFGYMLFIGTICIVMVVLIQTY